jgi:hypothetical protein
MQTILNAIMFACLGFGSGALVGCVDVRGQEIPGETQSAVLANGQEAIAESANGYVNGGLAGAGMALAIYLARLAAANIAAKNKQTKKEE